MITVETHTNGKNIEKLIEYYQTNFPLSKISKQIADDIKEETVKLGWHRIKNTILRRNIDRNTHEITMGGKDGDIAGYLHRGTEAHRIEPKNKKALSWTQKGDRFFSKGHIVSGIKPFKFFRVYNSTRNKLQMILKDFHKEAETKA